jgi:hypothetical protein
MLSVLAPPINTYELLKTANFEVAPCNKSYVDFLGYGLALSRNESHPI